MRPDVEIPSTVEDQGLNSNIEDSEFVQLVQEHCKWTSSSQSAIVVSICEACGETLTPGLRFHCMECLSLGFESEVGGSFCSSKCAQTPPLSHIYVHQLKPHPPPGITPCAVPNLGRCLLAGQTLSRGAPVLSEVAAACDSNGLLGCCRSLEQNLDAKTRARILALTPSEDEEQREEVDERFWRLPLDERGEDTLVFLQVLLNNAFNPGGSGHRFGLFEWMCLMPHSCIPNCVCQFRGDRNRQTCNADEGKDDDMIVTAIRDLVSGEVLSWNYCLDSHELALNTEKRQAAILERFGFWCKCPRCLSPTDTLRSFSCPRCNGVAIYQRKCTGAACQDVFRCSECNIVIDESELQSLESEERAIYFDIADLTSKLSTMNEHAQCQVWWDLFQRAQSSLGPWHAMTGQTALRHAEKALVLKLFVPAKESLVAALQFLQSPSMMGVEPFCSDSIASLAHAASRGCLIATGELLAGIALPVQKSFSKPARQ